MDNKIINFEDILLNGETALVGRENGLNYKKKLICKGIEFKEIEKKFNKITIIIPRKIMSMNKSFFLAVWSDRVFILGEEAFKNKYHFKTSEHIQHKIEKHIQAALLEVTQNEILGVE